MDRYVICFSKSGLIKYTSHLDMMRLFKRAFKRVGVPIEYSHGFNPHPRMSFAQPLSLGYAADEEFLEFQVYDDFNQEEALGALRQTMPEGIEIKYMEPLRIKESSLAACTVAALYEAVLPLDYSECGETLTRAAEEYLAKSEIIGQRRDKKTKKMVDKDIRPMIRDIKIDDAEGKVALVMLLDSGSKSNLSPEPVIETFLRAADLEIPRDEIEVARTKLFFDTCFPQRREIE